MMRRMLCAALGSCLLASCAVVNNPKTQAAIACSDLSEFALMQYVASRIVKRATEDDDPNKPQSKTKQRIDATIEAIDDDCFKHIDAKLDE